ncbi:MAG TPA: RNA 2',3'-cyclic phosphodiesterase [Actinomycetota bacterium]|nr:RNA 2',3'-cyclic phosphodiesterase [Actinomycetota bacterium]
MRLFVAVDVPERIKQSIESGIVGMLRDRLPDARWTRPQGRHLTLKFLGNVDDERVGEIGEALRAVARKHRPFDASFDDIGGFPNLSRPRVLWIGVGEGADPMSALAAGIESGLEPLGFEPEGRPFRGHFTLARFPKPRVIGALPELDVPSDIFGVSDVVLFRSQLHPKGARYTALERFPLSA